MSDRGCRILAAAAITGLAFLFSFRITPSDFAQDYLAAAAFRHGLDPNLPSRDLANRFGLAPTLVTSLQTAHPPLVTAISVPFAMLPWPEARILWQFGLALLTAVLLTFTGISAANMLCLAPAWIFGLALGNVDSIVVCLCLIVFAETKHRSATVVCCLGLATALKVYPALLIVGLFTTRRFRDAIGSVAVAGLLTLGAAWLIGFVSLVGWLRFIPRNGDAFAANMLNLSLSKVAALAGIPTFAVTLLGFVAAALLISKRRIDPLLPAILLVSPVIWLQSLPLISNLLATREKVLCCACSATIALSWFSGLRWAAYVGVAASFILTAAIVIVYYREAKPSHSNAGIVTPIAS